MKRKLLALFLTVCLIFSLSACAFARLLPSRQPSDSEGAETEPETDEPEQSEQPDEEEPSADEGGDSFTETVAVDNDECSFVITEVDPESSKGLELKALLENKSSDVTYTFTIDDAAINGVRDKPFFSSDVMPGNKANESIIFSTVEFEGIDIGRYSDIEIRYHVHDSEDWSADPVAEGTFHVYPYGEKNAVKYVREAQSTDNVIVDNEYVTVIVTGYDHDDIWGYEANLFLVNKTDVNVMFAVSNGSVNGYMMDPVFATRLGPGNCTFDTLSWSDSDLEENNITTVEEIEIDLRIYNADDWSEDNYVDDTFTLNP